MHNRFNVNVETTLTGRARIVAIAALVTFGLTGCGSDKLPCAKTAWAEDDGSMRIRVLFEQAECKALSEQYSALARTGGLSPASTEPMMRATGFLSGEKIDKYHKYLASSEFTEPLRGDFSKKAGDFKSFDDLQNPFKVQLQATYSTIAPVTKGGFGGYVLGDTGIIVMNAAKYPAHERIKSARATGGKLTEAEEALFQMLTRWNETPQTMKQGGKTAELVVLGNGQLAVAASSVARNSRADRNLAARTIGGDLITVNIDHAAILAMPPMFIDVQAPRAAAER